MKHVNKGIHSFNSKHVKMIVIETLKMLAVNVALFTGVEAP